MNIEYLGYRPALLNRRFCFYLTGVCSIFSDKEDCLRTGCDGFISKPLAVEEMLVLYDLAMSGDMEEILNQASHLEAMDVKYMPFARTLRELAQNFEEQKILALIKKYKE